MKKLICLLASLLFACAEPTTSTPVVVERCPGAADVVICSNCGIVKREGEEVELMYKNIFDHVSYGL